MEEQSNVDFKSWAAELPKNAIDIWREAFVNLRQLHVDVWNGVRFFLTVNGVLIAAGFTVARVDTPTPTTGLTLMALVVLGLVFTIVALRIFTYQRRNFVEMMVQKTLIDKELGFYETNINGVDLSFPWKVDRQYVPNLQSNPSKWQKEQRWRKRSISRLLLYVFVIMLVPLLTRDLVFSNALVLASIGSLDGKTQYYFLEAALVIYVLALILILIGFKVGYFTYGHYGEHAKQRQSLN
jgi:polyferredoxin